jgi:hypothetical protein
MPLIATRGAASAQGFGEFAQVTAANYIEDVFSTYLYTGNGSTQTITNGIDLSGKGGLTWIKYRSGAFGNGHYLYDTVRGAGKALQSNLTDAATAVDSRFTSFNSNGFSLETTGGSAINASTYPYVSWTFREQPKFFDIVTYTGTGSARTVAHNLGSVPGCMIIKQTNTGGADWAVYHRSQGATKYGLLNTTAAFANDAGNDRWNNTSPTSTVFTVGIDTEVNLNGSTYVAYLFAHDAGGFGLSGTDNVISCGSFTTDGSAYANVTLGYEPQWVLQKRTDTAQGWYLTDNMRGSATLGGQCAQLFPNTSGAESSGTGGAHPTATGFESTGLAVSGTFIYIAIRRGPMKVPTTGTSVFSPVARTGTGSIVNVTTPNFAPDLLFSRDRGSSVGKFSFNDKLRGPSKSLYSTDTAAEATTTGLTSFNNLGYTAPADGLSYNEDGDGMITECFQRAPLFFDEVCYTGTGSATTFSHNLQAVPELIIVKRRDTTGAWDSYCSALANTEYVVLNTTAAKATGATRWNSTTPTSSVFSVGTSTTTNASAGTYVAYLFATCAGVSKVGSYTGTGALQTVNCGFTSGARFVLIKRTDSTGDWWTYDSARGITSGNDPYLFLNSTAVEVTSTNYVDTDTTGFKVTAAAPAGLNASGGTYIFLAIA